MSEVAGGPEGRIELRQFPAQGTCLPRQRRNEGVDGGGVLGVPEELADSPAGDVAPAFGSVGIDGVDAPPLPGGPD